MGVAQAEISRQGAFEDMALSAEDASIGATTVEAEDAGQGRVRVTGGGTHCDSITRVCVNGSISRDFKRLGSKVEGSDLTACDE